VIDPYDVPKLHRAKSLERIPKLKTAYTTEYPPRRRLKIFTLDPLNSSVAGNRFTIDIPYEPLKSGPRGDRYTVIDYDGSRGVYYAPVDLNEPQILMREGLDWSESDPRFHQQMVYAVAMRVHENFERALGRPLRFAGGRPLRLVPHAFRGANAFFEPHSNSVLFGYFAADETNPGENLPGQIVFSCLSHDIVAHEVTHAIVNRLRKHFNEPTNRDVLAFHEAIADIVAIFQHFTVPDVLRGEIQARHGDISSPGLLLGLAKQFGHGTGRSAALRSALGDKMPNADDYKKLTEPHERGSLLVAAVFDAFFRGYQNRIRDVVRLATGGSGILPTGDLSSDLVAILATEASAAAQTVLTMCIRAFEFLPPVDVTFGDFLRALVTSDRDLYPEDRYGIRDALIQAFRIRGIYPENVNSLAEESLVWPEPKDADQPSPLDREAIGDLMTRHFFNEDTGPSDDAAGTPDPVPPSERVLVSETEAAASGLSGVSQDSWRAIYTWGQKQAGKLGLEQGPPVSIQGLHPTFRIGSNGRVRLDIVAQFIQERIPDANQAGRFGGLRLFAGATVIFDQRGRVRYVISKPLPDKGGSNVRSLETIARHVASLDETDAGLVWHDADSFARRMIERSNFAMLDRPESRR
jgi:hypothetical protein